MLPCPAPISSRPESTGSALVNAYLRRLVTLRLLDEDTLTEFQHSHADRLADCNNLDRLGQSLVRCGLLTRYQLERVRVGATHGLVLGNYRVLESLGSGAMGLVYEAEHCILRSRVAVKMVPIAEDQPASMRQRFVSEMRLLAQLDHPNVVRALDAGEVPAKGPDLPALSYLVMELVPGGDLDQYVTKHGALPIQEACEYASQAASGLQAAHDRHLIHRDLKPSNLLRTADGRIKLVDFGLARQCSSRLTDPRMMLGSLEFMAPEQSYNAAAVGPEADIYGLGATLFWMLTGEAPYSKTNNPRLAVQQLRQEAPRLLRALRPDAPEGLQALLARCLDRDPDKRPARARIVVEEMVPYLSYGAVVIAGTAGAPQDQAAREIAHLTATREALRRSLNARSSDLERAHDALLFTMAKMAESRDGETPGHLNRLQAYVTALASKVAEDSRWRGIIDARFCRDLVRCVPLHDIGKIGLPEELLLKPGALSATERKLVETHPLIGDRILEALAREHGTSLEFLGMARSIVRSHHERWDGRGYPDHLVGEAIPSGARLVAVADVYDALRRERMHKPGLTHEHACKVIMEKSPGQFDPALVHAFHLCHGEFERIYQETRD